MESVELSCIFGGNINCFSHLGKLFGSFNEVKCASNNRKHIIGFYLYEVQEEAKRIYCSRSQKSGYFLEGRCILGSDSRKTSGVIKIFCEN